MIDNVFVISLKGLECIDLNNWCKPYITQAEGYAAIGVAEKGVDRRIYVKNEKGNIVTLTVRSVAITDPNKVAIYVEEEEK